jgi:hypothetical protein
MAISILDIQLGAVDLSGYMRKDVYDTNNDGVVDKISKLTDITELANPQPGQVPVAIDNNNTDWDDAISSDVDGGTY